MSDVPLPEPTPGCWWDAEAIAAMHTYAAAVSAADNAAIQKLYLDEAEKVAGYAAENARLREALQAVQTAMHGAWADGRLTSPPWTDALAAQVATALKGEA
jgi:hypothetical protein